MVEIITLIITTVGASVLAIISLFSHVRKIKMCCCKSECMTDNNELEIIKSIENIQQMHKEETEYIKQTKRRSFTV